ncbi:MAG: hypothetical protein WAV27_08540 [Xanthobacteraceae bacterium]
MAGGAETGDCGGLVRAGLVSLTGCPALRRECEPGIGWRKRYRDDPHVPAVPAAPQLIPVVVTGEQDAVVAQSSSVSETIEIDLAGKYRVRISSGVDVQALRRVLDVLERR